MKVLYASERPPYPFFLGGAARCAHELLVRLASEPGIECIAVGSAAFDHPPWNYPAEESYSSLGINEIREDRDRRVVDCGYPVQVLDDFPNALDDLAGQFLPDVIWTQMEGAQQVAAFAKRTKIPSLYFIHDAELPSSELKALAKLGCGFVASSHFLAQKSRRFLKQSIGTVYPCPRLDFGVSGAPDGYITMINPHRVKGVETFYAIARRRPDVKFLLLESWKLKDGDLQDLRKHLEELPNVEFRYRVSDMAMIYAETRLLLVPSIWEEGFGMVVVEAQSCGIPVIASNRGGLPESTGEGGMLIDDFKNPSAWIEAMHAILDDPAIYRLYAERAMLNAQRNVFDCSYSASVFRQVIEEVVKRGCNRGNVLRRVKNVLTGIFSRE